MREYAVEEPVDTQGNAAWVQMWCASPRRSGMPEAFSRVMLKSGRMLERSNATPEQRVLALAKQRESVSNHLSSACKPLKKGNP